MSGTPLRHVNVSATTTAVGYPCRLRGFTITVKSESAGQIALTNGTPTGELILRRDICSGNYMDAEEHFGELGMRFVSCMHVSIPASVVIGIIYD